MSKCFDEILRETDEIPSICKDKKKTIEWLRQNQLILQLEQFKCPIDGTQMFQYGDNSNCDGLKFKCSACRLTKTSKFGSFFEQFRLPIRLVVRVLFVCFLRNYPIETAMMEVQAGRATIQKIYSFGMEMIYKWDQGERGGAFSLNFFESNDKNTNEEDGFVIQIEDQKSQKNKKKKSFGEKQEILKALKDFYEQYTTIEARLGMFLIILQTLASVKISESCPIQMESEQQEEKTKKKKIKE